VEHCLQPVLSKPAKRHALPRNGLGGSMRLEVQAVQELQHGTRQPMPCPVLTLCMLHAFPQPATPRKVRHGASGRAARAQAEHACPARGSKLFCRPGGCRPGRPRPATSPYCMAARAHAANSIKTAFTPTHPRRPAQSICRVRRGGGTPHVARCWEHHAQVLLVYRLGRSGAGSISRESSCSVRRAH